ncbi:D-alanyl-D-alanine carboxypeptidase family protein [Tissierella sp.]|uniref:D-alanyl-D-alanine carboxypeptidase family protein n=1 Tax=Tissierella sp. TaxID=41274 RepID=UPI0028579851|nr:D-alanyl-D-alanine carboxypeptidase family protein [Tissierella sp.]MDR7857359.1 D-alanyl-D-alanine carboxypeptidase family protein [Tissierella sp.]
MKRLLSIFLALMMIITSSAAYGDIGMEENLRSYILADFQSGEVLEEYNIDEIVETASISKLMSYLVIMDEVTKGNVSIDDKIIIDKDTTKINGSSLKLKLGEEFTVKELLEASIVVSANDATYALSKHIAKTEENFVKLMNEKAKELGLVNSMFYNSTGLPVVGKDVQNKMTTREIFLLSKYIIDKYPNILETTKIKAIGIASRDYFQRNTNPLLIKIEEVDGLKTGFTNKAGYCHVSTFNIKGRATKTTDLRLISIVMGAEDIEERNEMSQFLVQYGIDNYSNKIFLDEELAVETLYFSKGDITEVNAFPEKHFSKLTKSDENIKLHVDIDEDLKLPLHRNSNIGKAVIEKDGEVIFETNILIKEDVNKAKWYVLLGRFFQELGNKISELLDKYL